MGSIKVNGFEPGTFSKVDRCSNKYGNYAAAGSKYQFIMMRISSIRPAQSYEAESISTAGISFIKEVYFTALNN